MVKGGKVSSKRRVKPRIQSDYKGSDDSDEDYVVSDEEKLDLEEDYCSSLDASEEEVRWARKNSRSRGKKGGDRFIVEEEEDEEEMEKVRKNGRSRAKKVIDRFILDEEEEDELEELEEEEDEEEMKMVRKNGRSRVRKGKGRFIVDEEEDELEELKEEDEEEMKKVRKGKGRFIVDEEEDELEELEEEDEEEMKKVRKGKGRFIVDEEEDELEELEEEDEEEMKKVRKGKGRFIVDEEEDELEELEEEDEEETKKVRKNGRSRVDKEEDELEELKEEEEEEEEEGEGEKEEEVRNVARSKSQNGLSGRPKNGFKPSQKRRRTKSEEMADQDYEEEEDEDDEYDEEFTPDEDDYSEVEEASRVKKRKTNLKVSKRRLKKNAPIRRKSKKPSRKKQKKTRTLRRKVRSDDDDGDFMNSNLPVREKNEKKRPKKRRRYVAQSDSDFVSGSSDCDYTISEEEREQVREAVQLCASIEPNLRTSLLSDSIQEKDVVQPQPPRKPPGRKGKEKIEQVKVEVVKQVCGICLSEEDKRRVRGTLDCCTHFFCFSCIMEWGKVESRCPLCKQRFKTISKPTRAGTELRDVCVTVPERDQVYQPTEEELRSYLDPYENVICTECHEGGDDGLMLLCDLCDSPAHTYCVGLGQEVPEGNWYCDGCRPVALGSSGSQVQGWFTEQRTANNILPNRHSPAVSFSEGLEIDLNSLSSPRSYITQGFGTSSPWYHVGGFQAASPGSGLGAPTLSGRRLMHRHIQQLISANRMNYLASRNERSSSANLSTDTLNAQTAQGRETIVQHARTDGTGRTFHTFFEERLQENPSLPVQENDVFSSTSSHHRRHVLNPTTTSADRPSNGTLWPGLTENTVSGHVQTHHFSNRPNIGFDGDLSPNAVMGPSDIHRGKEQLQTLVINYIKDLSREKDFGQSTTAFQEIARSAMQTVLAACELEHIGNDVIPVPPPSPCSHIELMAGKTSLIKGCCSSCFAQFVENVVKLIMEQKQASWLRLGL